MSEYTMIYGVGEILGSRERIGDGDELSEACFVCI